MKMFNRATLSGFFGLSDDDTYEEEYSANEKQPVANQENNRSNSSFFRQSRNDSYEAGKRSEPQQEAKENRKVVTMSTSQNRPTQDHTTRESNQGTARKVTVLEPRTYTEAKKIAECIFKNEVVIVNFHLVEETQARRIVDFLTGSVFALNGDIQRIGEEMFLCTPPNIEIDSTVAKSLLGSHFAEY